MTPNNPERWLLFDSMSDIAVTSEPEVIEETPIDQVAERSVIILTVEGVESQDSGGRRELRPGSMTWGELPMTYTRNHDDDQVVGRIDAIGRVASTEGLTVDNFAETVGETGDFIVGFIVWDLESESGREAARLAGSNIVRSASVEIGGDDIEWTCLETETLEDVEVLDDDLIGEELCTLWKMWVNEGVITQVSQVSSPAFAEAVIVDSALVSSRWHLSGIFDRPRPIAASATLTRSKIPTDPPAAWFSNPNFDRPTPITVEEDGRFYGHLALWDVCHTGIGDRCQMAIHSPTDYFWFHCGTTKCDDGSEVRTGILSMDGLHTDTRAMSVESARNHHENTLFQAGAMRAGEDKFGIWCAGALDAEITDAQIRRLRRGSMSGEWPPLTPDKIRVAQAYGKWNATGDTRDLVMVLAVNRGGFPIPEVAVAASHGCGCGGKSTEQRLHRIETIIDAAGLEKQAADAIAASLARP